ncbi:MAG: hypothetical protein COV45_08240 [Deltaproteobacteria bacterium CG11_big_fil_rev_8_21_14_0_20_47_16]|nr:MAG: hypothetical protein COV45_08240 [Deltaproteobacteria bacterium CG11_big_fil_rev_8_21_14_0_20_47_16]
MKRTLSWVFAAAFAAGVAVIIGLQACGGGSSSSGGGSTPTVTCSSSERTFTMVNNSGQDIWVGITSGSVSCTVDADCPTGASGSCVAQVCNCPTGNECGSIATCKASNSLCYWNTPSLTTAQANLASGASSTVCFPAPGAGQDNQWGGKIFARTGCDSNGQNCKTGDCGANSSGICPTATGGNPPTTLAEFTLSNQSSFTTTPNTDYYDISIINGINVGIKMAPVSGTYSAGASPYSCGIPGNTSAVGQLSACSWTVSPTVSGTDRTTLLRDVYPTSFTGSTCPDGGSPNSLGYCTCTLDSQCSSSGLVCGLAQNASSAQYTQVCGSAIGWWTADQLCGSVSGTSAALEPLGCSLTVTNSDGSSSTYTQLYECTGTQHQSCYTSGAAAYCCGCATSVSADYTAWPTVVSSSFGGSDNGCYNNNTNWVSISQPWLVFLKSACPTAYTYPYDDATSTFTCIGSSTVGATNYTITFLPTQ